MNINLEDAKNASLTCSVNGRFLHSKYNPENEAKNFIDSIECNYTPSCVIITGPCLPYCIPFLRERFPNTPLYAIQYDTFFSNLTGVVDERIKETEKWTGTFLCLKDTNIESLSEILYSALGEEAVFATLLVSWKAADTVFSDESKKAWEALRILIQKSRDVLATRSFFSTRWLKNTVQFCVHARNIATFKLQSAPVFLIASGPSLKHCLDFIHKFQKRAIIIALSSSLCTLVQNDIIPDVCISTDGGYYAKKHLEILLSLAKKGYSIPLAVSPESNVGGKILETIPIIPLTYNDGIETKLLHKCKIPAECAERNGSVSGTASQLALSLTTNNIYAFGLDLSIGKGYSHTNPNAHELINLLGDVRLRPLAHRTASSELSLLAQTLSPLAIYRQWFETRNSVFANRFYRVFADGYAYKNTLGKIKDLAVSEMKNDFGKDIIKDVFAYKSKIDEKKARITILRKYITKQRESPSKEWIETCALLECLATKKHPKSKEHAEKFLQKLTKAYKSVEGLLQ